MTRILYAAAAVSVLLFSPIARADTDLDDLVERADLAYLSKTSAAVVSMDIKTKSFQRTYKIVSWDDRRKSNKTLIKILGPALYRGFGTLKLGDSLKLYNPKTNHVTVVSSSMLGDSWMGSHFTNDDLVKQTELAKDYDLSLLKKWKGTVGSRKVVHYRIKLTPKPSAPVAWGKIVYELWEHPDAVIPVKADYYRKKSSKKPSRTMTWSKLEKIGGRLLPARLEMTVAKKPGEYTRITYTKLKLDVKIPKRKFTEQALRK
jgi:outer membrane lipoprotein-sorting protein